QMAVMSLHDLLRDRQAQPRVLTEILLRAISIKPLEDLIDRIRPDAGTIVIDGDEYFAPGAAAGHPHRAAGRRERAGIVDQVVHDLAQPGIMTLHPENARRAFEREDDRRTAFALALVRHGHHAVHHLAQSARP